MADKMKPWMRKLLEEQISGMPEIVKEHAAKRGIHEGLDLGETKMAKKPYLDWVVGRRNPVEDWSGMAAQDAEWARGSNPLYKNETILSQKPVRTSGPNPMIQAEEYRAEFGSYPKEQSPVGTSSKIEKAPKVKAQNKAAKNYYTERLAPFSVEDFTPEDDYVGMRRLPPEERLRWGRNKQKGPIMKHYPEYLGAHIVEDSTGRPVRLPNRPLRKLKGPIGKLPAISALLAGAGMLGAPTAADAAVEGVRGVGSMMPYVGELFDPAVAGLSPEEEMALIQQYSPARQWMKWR